MAEEQVHLIVRKPLADIEREIRSKYGVRTALADVAIEEEALVFTFEGVPHTSKPVAEPRDDSVNSDARNYPTRKRRKRRIRNRMKTRGWDVLAKFVNDRGQSCTIYRPFYEALRSGKLKHREAYSAVREILVSNGNSPKPSSVEYFLRNTLEYIANQTGRSPPVTHEDTAPAK